MKTISKFLIFCLVLTMALSCTKDKSEETGGQSGTAAVRLHFLNMAGADTLQFGSTYQTALGEDITPQIFKYYISNISFRDAENNNDISAPETYHLVNQSDPASLNFTLNMPAESFTQISFLLGVDSIRNVSGAQTGDLDPAKEMFWTWNSGYIMAKLEGTSTFSTEVQNAVTYHIGGFKTGENVTRRVTLNFPGGERLTLVDNKTADVFITADMLQWFSGSHDFSIAQHPTVTTPGALATSIADNYANMFNVFAVNNP